MSLVPPPKLRRLQEALYTTAKQEPADRFSRRYDRVYRTDILAHASARSQQQGGAPGVDGVTVADSEAAGVEAWLAAVPEALRPETYRPHPVRRAPRGYPIPQPGGTGERPLGIPVIGDRGVQTAALRILPPLCEADREPTAYGSRPGRTARAAVQAVHRALGAGQTAGIDADVSKYLETSPHADRMQSLARRLSDRRRLRRLKGWLTAPVAEQAAGGGGRFTGGKRARRGTPQGGVGSPRLATRYMHRDLQVLRRRGRDRRHGARLVH